MKYSIRTKGMGCPHCIKRVTKAMEGLGAVIEKMELNDFAVESDKSADEIRAAIEALGFEVTEIKAD